MRKLITTFFMLFLVLTATAQEWSIYDGSVMPDVAGWTNTGDGNDSLNLFHHEVLDSDEAFDGKLYRFDATNRDTTHNTRYKEVWTKTFDAQPTALTVVARAKGLNTDGPLNFIINNGQFSANVTLFGSRMRVHDASDKYYFNYDHTIWHTYRITAIGDSVKVYMDEIEEPVLKNKMGTTTTDVSISWGDAWSSAYFGADVDYVIYTIDSAYSPSELPLPQEVLPPAPAPDRYNVIFVSTDEGDSLQLKWLEEQGYNVSPWWPANGPALITEDEIAAFDTTDLVIIARSNNSSDLATLQDYFHRTTTPVMCNHPYGVRSHRMQWFNTTRIVQFTESSTPAIYNVHVKNTSDEIFSGVTLSDDSLAYSLAPHDFVIVPQDIQNQSNGEILAAHDSLLVMARFAPNVEYYEGSGKAPAGHRSYFGFGHDQLEPNMFPLTEDARLVYAAELLRLCGLDEVAANNVATLDGIEYSSTMLEGFDAAKTVYAVELPAGSTLPLVIARPTDPNAMVSIVHVSSFPGKSVITVTAADGVTEKTYEINFTEEEQKSSDATLAEILVDGVALANFDPATLTYEIELFEGITAPPVIAATTTDSKATLSITQATDLESKAKIEVTAEDGTMVSYEISFIVPNTPLGFSDMKASIYPNPASEYLTVQIRQSKGAKVSLVNMYGMVVKQQSVLHTSVEFDVAELPAGLYFIKIEGNGVKESHKLILK